MTTMTDVCFVIEEKKKKKKKRGERERERDDALERSKMLKAKERK